MPRILTEVEITRAICQRMMDAWGFAYWRRTEWIIYGARHRVCSTCSAPPNSPCLNMADVKAGKDPRVNKQPHDERIDWDRILVGLQQRGYYNRNVELHVRREVARRGG